MIEQIMAQGQQTSRWLFVIAGGVGGVIVGALSVRDGAVVCYHRVARTAVLIEPSCKRLAQMP